MITLGTIYALTSVLMTAGAPAAGAATPLWFTILMGAIGPVLVFLGAWATGLISLKGKRIEVNGSTKAKIEEIAATKARDMNAYALGQMEAFAKRIDQQDGKIALLERKERKHGEYISQLRQHIDDRLPPPPPPWPDFNGSHTSETPTINPN